MRAPELSIIGLSIASMPQRGGKRFRAANGTVPPGFALDNDLNF
jgi:hypothetical protein